MLDRDRRRRDRVPGLGDLEETLRGAAGYEPAAERLGVDVRRPVELLRVVRVDAGGEPGDLGLERLEEREVVPVERWHPVVGPAVDADGCDAQPLRQLEQRRVRVVDRLATPVEADTVGDLHAPGAPADPLPGLEHDHLAACPREAVGGREARESRSDDDRACHAPRTRTLPAVGSVVHALERT